MAFRRSTWYCATVSRNLDNTVSRPFIVNALLPRLIERDTKHTETRSRLAARWNISIVPSSGTFFDEKATSRYLKQLARYSVGHGALEVGVLNSLSFAVGHEFGSLQSPGNMRKMLEAIGFVEPNDNIFRIMFSGNLKLPETVHSHVGKHLTPDDPFDGLRTMTTENIYAIDSATTSEVDDAIGLSVDASGREWITVYVSDATAHVPFDSDLEVESGRYSGTTVYLPEGVYFMLPKPIIEAATLKSNARCRTFNIRFRVNDDGSIADFDVSMGFTEHLRRITYDDAQDLIASRATAPLSSSPSWVKADDVRKIRRLHEIGKLLDRQREGKAFTCQLPDPYVRVDLASKRVLTVADQVSTCADAYNLVAAFMIAANEACSRIAQKEGICIPFRGSRPLSTVHQAARDFQPPQGRFVAGNPALETSTDGRFAASLLVGLEALRGVTRAMYHHEPLFHNGLNTNFYTHSTSPLRRYADMLVHHQMKVLIGRRAGKRILVPIESFQMAELCQTTTNLAVAADLTQTNSTRYWVLKYLQDLNRRSLQCIVGFTHDISGCPDEERAIATRYRFRSDVFVPELQLLHTVCHNDASVRTGSLLNCAVDRLYPETGVLELRLLRSEAPREGMIESLVKFAKAAE
jgi:exoribonuclease R